ncbi:nuclease (SNase-like) [Bartonella australis AUST/NH1]|uniref:Nuclease (SNase-like) n=1 Tax=Bartonella australis (strain Aust/NH1) TaxID=1094489 RepID=M1NUH0_BARAA|nr:nuclease (SNase-like) [Bartonella australis]AGF74923.1 nuclease (SNase-like) [Bartonella australis AUST/NH1]
MRLIYRNKSKSLFRRIILVYIIAGGLYTLSQNSNFAQKLLTDYQSKNIMKDQITTTKKKVEDDTAIYNSIKLDETLPVYSGFIQVTSGSSFKMITPVDEPWRKRIMRRVRLYGVESCEPRQFAVYNGIKWPCGSVATAWLVTKTLNQNVVCQTAKVVNQIHYAQCLVSGVDIARLGLSEGMMILSLDQKDFPSPSQYKQTEYSAKIAGVGIWSSEFDRPEAWRRQYGNYNPLDPQ